VGRENSLFGEKAGKKSKQRFKRLPKRTGERKKRQRTGRETVVPMGRQVFRPGRVSLEATTEEGGC